MRRVWALGCWAFAVSASAASGVLASNPTGLPGFFRSEPAKRILLVPLDDRPATTQFAQMIGQIAGASVESPPLETLGRFTMPGKPEQILEWMRQQDLSRYDAVVVSTDMMAYGGLIASREADTDYRVAINRLRALQKLRRGFPGTKFFAFSSIMRIAPTSLRSNGQWRDRLAQYVTQKAKPDAATNPEIKRKLAALASQIPAGRIEDYYGSRLRDHKVQQELLRMLKVNVFDYLILGQDDAQPIGPHIAETSRLKTMAANLKVGPRVYFCEGIDQHSNVLISRALLSKTGWTPSVRVVYADEEGRGKLSPHETAHLESSLKDQLIASGARQALPGEQFDYSLYVNTRDPRPDHFQTFVGNLTSEIDQGFPVAVADINLGKTGTGDPVLFDSLNEGNRCMKLLAYAGWNTTGNTIGTAIPAANVYLLSRRLEVDPLIRELNQRAFLLHRLVNDFEYHRFTRPLAYKMQERSPESYREETYGTAFDALNAFVRSDVERRLEETFRNQFLGKRFFAGNRQYEVRALRRVDVELPWPRAYEVRIGFQMEAQEVEPASQ